MSYVTPNEKPDPHTDSPTPEETPLTEAHLFGARGGERVTEVKAVVRANFARRLERENTALRAHAERLAEALKDIAETLEAHEVDTLDCDRAGNKFCTCLERRISKADNALTLYRAENPKE